MGHSLRTSEVEALLRHRVPVTSYDKAFPPGANLREILDATPERAIVFLYRNQPAYGHWVACYDGPRPGTVSVFDSYGDMRVDEWSRKVPRRIRKELGEDTPRLAEAILRSDYDGVFWSEYGIQAVSPLVTTCGRWCVVRLWCRDLDPDEFAALVSALCEQLSVTPDLLVTALTVAQP